MGRRGITVAFALAACAGAAVAAGAAFGGEPARNGEIAFVRCCPTRIVLARPDGSHQRELTRGPGDERTPAFSPDGETVVFSRGATTHDRFGELYANSIYAIGADGRGERRLTPAGDDDRDPTFSPDGRTIAFGSLRWSGAGFYTSDYGGIYVMDADGRHERRLTYGRLDGSPVFSPDGRRVVFVRPQTGDRGSVPGVYAVDVDGRHEHRLGGFRSGDSAPSFSPGGRTVVFTRGVDSPPRSGDCWETDVFTARADGTRQRRLTRTRCGAFDPHFSPDGRRIVFSLYLDGRRHGGVWRPAVYVMHRDGTHRRPLAPARDGTWSPAWQPAPVPRARDESRRTLGT